MLTIRDLMEDKTWREEVLLKRPPQPICTSGKPWRVYVLGHDNRWRKRDCASYGEAFKFLKKMLKTDARDVNISCRVKAFAPPERLVKIKNKYVVGNDGVKRQATKYVTWKPRLQAEDEQGHRWCPYCRRPTVFKWFRYHHAMGSVVMAHKLRCTICGISEDLAYWSKSS